jgi:hypothetical protein
MVDQLEGERVERATVGMGTEGRSTALLLAETRRLRRVPLELSDVFQSPVHGAFRLRL